MRIEKLENLMQNQEEFKKLKNRGSREVVLEYGRTKNNIEHYNYTTDFLEIKDIWSDDIQDALNFMKENGVNKFIFTDTSTEACKSIIKFLENGCKLSPIVYAINETYGGQLKEELKGILVEL